MRDRGKADRNAGASQWRGPNGTVSVPHEERVVRTGEIKALSGLRIVAAVWVVLFHFRPLLAEAAPGFRSAFAPVLDCGAQGVDLFFILSGFVLTWNYLDRMGDSWSWRSTLHFLWLRLSRVWPVYLVTMHLAALWIIFTLNVGHVPSEAADQLTRDELRPSGPARPAVVPALLRRVELGRTRLVDQRRMAGLPHVRRHWCWSSSGSPARRGRGA